MWLLLVALMLLLIGVCPTTPAALAVPAIVVAGVILLTWEPAAPAVAVVSSKPGPADPLVYADSRGPRRPGGPAGGKECSVCAAGADWVEFRGRSGDAGWIGCPARPGAF